MFTYFHCYLPETWDAQVKAGLINEHSGIRFAESIDLDENKKFNNLARKGGELYNILKERKCPFYIDRLQGGCFIENYDYDMDLIAEYKEMLKGNFWGFQMHEWMSNYLSDINKLNKGEGVLWTEEGITKAIFDKFNYSYIFLESMNAKEMADNGCPKTADEFVSNSKKLFEKRQKYTDGMLISCDSAFMAYPIEFEYGIKRIMPEVGWQTADTRVQLAYARGMAKAKGIPYGAYYEPWGGSPFSACNYQRDMQNEWNIGSSADFPFEAIGENGGSSRSLQRRIQLYSYMAGASFMSEEWGMCNTFYDWKSFELTPYGKVKKEFIDFTEKYSEIGTPVTPIVIVIPNEILALQSPRDYDYLGFNVDKAFSDKIMNVRRIILKLLCASGKMVGTESRAILNCIVPDAIDIVNEDYLIADNYRYIVDATGNSEFAEKYKDKIISADDVTAKLNELLPAVIEGNVMKQMTELCDGRYYILLMNNSGVNRTVAEGESFITEAEEMADIAVKDGKKLKQLEGDASTEPVGENRYKVNIPAGGWFFGIIE